MQWKFEQTCSNEIWFQLFSLTRLLNKKKHDIYYFTFRSTRMKLDKLWGIFVWFFLKALCTTKYYAKQAIFLSFTFRKMETNLFGCNWNFYWPEISFCQKQTKPLFVRLIFMLNDEEGKNSNECWSNEKVMEMVSDQHFSRTFITLPNCNQFQCFSVLIASTFLQAIKWRISRLNWYRSIEWKVENLADFSNFQGPSNFEFENSH